MARSVDLKECKYTVVVQTTDAITICLSDKYMPLRCLTFGSDNELKCHFKSSATNVYGDSYYVNR